MGLVDEDIFSAIDWGNEAEALTGIEPLDGALKLVSRGRESHEESVGRLGNDGLQETTGR